MDDDGSISSKAILDERIRTFEVLQQILSWVVFDLDKKPRIFAKLLPFAMVVL
jgi:hypothetical protein